MSSIFCPQVSLLLASIPDDGMRVEMVADSPGSPEQYPEATAIRLASFRAEREGEVRMVFEVAGCEVEVPVDEIKRALDFARKEVHPESGYPYPPEVNDDST